MSIYWLFGRFPGIRLLEKEPVRRAQADVKSALESGADVEPGLFRPSLKFTERTNISWKSVVERVLASTKADKYVKLVVTA